MPHALVTGGCGFLGSAIVRALLDRGHAVRVLALPDEPADNLAGLDVEILRGDILDVDTCRKATTGMHQVYHTAAMFRAWMPNPSPMYRINLGGTFNVLEAARRAEVDKVIYTASVVSLGRPEPGSLADEDTPYEGWDVDFPYSRSKYHSRMLAEDFARWGLDVRIVCPSMIFGPRDIRPTPSGQIILDALQGGLPFYFAGGIAVVDVRDAAEVHLLAAERGQTGETYIASAHNVSNLELLRAINRASGTHRRYIKLPLWLARLAVARMNAVARRTGEHPPLSRDFFEYGLKSSYYANTKAIERLGARFRPLDETVSHAIEDFQRRGMVPDLKR